VLQYLEPRTDVPAKDDWSTRLALTGVRAVTEDRVVLLVSAVTLVATSVVPSTPGNTLAMVVLAFSVLSYLSSWFSHRGVRSARRRGLLDEPWRRVPAAVAEKPANDGVDRLLLDGLVLEGKFGGLPDVVLERREVFVCGPDADGHAVVRAAGSTSMYQARVGEGEFPARERVERVLGRPGDEKRIRDGLALTRQMRPFQWLLLVMFPGIVVVLIVMSLSPPAPTGLIAAALWTPGLLSVPSSIEVLLRDRAIAKAVAGSQPWTPVPMALFPWQRGRYVAGIAELPDGPALVRFPRPWVDLVANIADTKVMWIAGTHEDVLAVGVPGTNLLNFAEVRPQRDAQRSEPLPWWRRYRQPDFSALPR
jgi:hypothetical protein